MRYKRIVFFFINVFIFCLVTGCNGRQLSTTIPLQTPELTGTPVLFPTPVITSTPIDISFKSEEELRKVIHEKYAINPKCEFDLSSSKEEVNKVPNLEFIHSDVFPNSPKTWVFEIADSPSKSLRAFTACDADPCKPKLFIEYRDKGIVKEINWSGRNPGRPINNLMWIGEELLSFSHLTNPHDAIVSTININTKSFLYYWLVGYPCQ